ncbi:DMT family transporter [Prevotella sp. E13-17]|uniref:DMT family transporter n=1 Tax=Prevotella sp. E13-17 TaxID=2913616 RepID=UPI001ED9C807|nr:DMT family transporter [Prevotella sp. E13-17]UKK50459.1 DMT family transporter [Prevotella sp. E13-17]
MDNKQPLYAHLSMFAACAIWGLMAPLGKDAMNNGLDGPSMVMIRVMGGAVLFWIASLFTTYEPVPWKHVFTFAGAAVFGIVCNQCGFTIGLSYTSPINASIVTTSMPIFAMLLAALILKEPLTSKKVLGVLMGCSGALMLILTSATHASDKVGDIRGDLCCLGAQFSYALYLSVFNKFIKQYSIFTVNKWMFLWATIILMPIVGPHTLTMISNELSTKTLLETGYVVFFGTFVGYILIIKAQKVLRPTVVSVYNYVQPIVAVAVSVMTGIGIMKWSHALAIILVVSGVTLVTKSKSRRDIEGK